MALTAIFEHIGAKIKLANPWINTYAVNCIQLPDTNSKLKGRVVNFVGEEKDYSGIDDSKGTSFYIRTNPKFTYVPQRQLTSCEAQVEVTVGFKFVFFAINQDTEYNPMTLENIFSNNLRQMNFGDYFGIERKIKIVLVNSNTDSFQVFFDEIGKKFDTGSKAVCISIEAQLKFLSTKDCEEECGISVSGNIISGIDFCQENNVNLLSVTQKNCLIDALCEGHGGVCEDATVKNSDDSYQDTVVSGGVLTLPDETFEFYLDGVLVDTETEPALSNQTFNIDWN